MEEEEEVVEMPLLRRKPLLLKKKLRRLPQLLICSAAVSNTHQLLSVIKSRHLCSSKTDNNYFHLILIL